MYITMMVQKMSSIMWLRASSRQFSPAELLVSSKTPLSSHLGGIKKTAAGGDDVAEETRSTFMHIHLALNIGSLLQLPETSVIEGRQRDTARQMSPRC